MQMLEHVVNRFNGIEMSGERLPADAGEFRRRLAHSLDVWRADGRAVVWIELPIAQASLIAPATEAGFTFHHTMEDSLTLVYRLQGGRAGPLLRHPLHRRGRGGAQHAARAAGGQ